MKSKRSSKPTTSGLAAAAMAAQLPGAEPQCEATPPGQTLRRITGGEAAELVRRLSDAQRAPRARRERLGARAGAG
jgi:hypothetical protein